jgi:hypothetical protein
MVNAILAGRKTQTRRVVKAPAWWKGMTHYCAGNVDAASLTRTNMALCTKDADKWAYCPYGVPGERLWVRETWGQVEWSSLADPSKPSRFETVYRAGPHPFDRDTPWGWNQKNRWRPSIHMPRWASRITLEITEVRVERLHEISESDCWAEGIEEIDGMFGNTAIIDMANRLGCCIDDAKPTYACLWESINGPGSWAANPWVWAVSFRRLEAPDA